MVIGAGINAGSVYSIMVGIANVLALVTHISGAAEPGGTHNTYNQHTRLHISQ